MFIVVVICSLLLHMLALVADELSKQVTSVVARRHSAGPSTFAEVTAVTKLTKRILKKKEEYIRSNSLGDYILTPLGSGNKVSESSREVLERSSRQLHSFVTGNCTSASLVKVRGAS